VVEGSGDVELLEVGVVEGLGGAVVEGEDLTRGLQRGWCLWDILHTRARRTWWSKPALTTCHTSTHPSTWRTSSRLEKLMRFSGPSRNIMFLLNYLMM